MAPRMFAGILGAVLAITGLVLLIMPVSVTVAGESGACNSSATFGGVPTDLLLNNQAYQDFHDSCADETGTREAWSWGLIGIGLTAAIGSAVVRRPNVPAPPVTS